MSNDDFANKLVEEDGNEFNVFLDTLKEVFDKQPKKGKEHHE